MKTASKSKATPAARQGVFKCAADGASAEIFLYQEIGDYYGGISAQWFLEQLKELGPVKELTVRINSIGGLVFEGFSIFNALKQHPANIVVKIDGLAASIASVIAMAGDRIEIASNAMIMIHRPTNIVWGDADEMRKSAGVLDKLEESIVAAYVARTGGDEAEIAAMVQAETWLNAGEALALGFADLIVEEQAAEARAYDLSGFRNAPKDLPRRAPIGNVARDQEAARVAAEVAVRLQLVRLDDVS